jgi:hypothetical protein
LERRYVHRAAKKFPFTPVRTDVHSMHAMLPFLQVSTPFLKQR